MFQIVITITLNLFSLGFFFKRCYFISHLKLSAAVVASAVAGLICSLKVGVVLTLACLCGHVTTFRPRVWLSAAQQCISCPKQWIHNACSASECFSKCHCCLAKAHLSPASMSRTSVVFLGFFKCANSKFFCFVFYRRCVSDFDVLMEELMQHWE